MFVAYPLPDGSYYQLRFLPWSVVAQIEREHGVSWVQVIDAPQVNGRVLADIRTAIDVQCDLGLSPIETVGDLIEFSNALVVVDANGQPVVTDETLQELAPLSWSAEG